METIAGYMDGGQEGPADPSLTPRRRKIIRVIEESVRNRGYPPSLREIGEAVGLASTSSVSHQMRVLQAKGKADRHTWLIPHNPAYTPILADSAVIIGKVVSVLRRLLITGEMAHVPSASPVRCAASVATGGAGTGAVRCAGTCCCSPGGNRTLPKSGSSGTASSARQ